MRKKQCKWCQKQFSPHPRLKDRQKSCGSNDCKRKQKRLSQRNLQSRDRAAYQLAQRDWRAKNPNYWKTYRKEHPDYTQRNRVQSKLRWQQAQLTLQKRIDILQLAENTIKYWNLLCFAKQPRSIHPLLWAYRAPHEHLESHPP